MIWLTVECTAVNTIGRQGQRLIIIIITTHFRPIICEIQKNEKNIENVWIVFNFKARERESCVNKNR